MKPTVHGKTHYGGKHSDDDDENEDVV
jgi:hypothetical protein